MHCKAGRGKWKRKGNGTGRAGGGRGAKLYILASHSVLDRVHLMLQSTAQHSAAQHKKAQAWNRQSSTCWTAQSVSLPKHKSTPPPHTPSLFALCSIECRQSSVVLMQAGKAAPVGLLCLLFCLSSALVDGHKVAEHDTGGQQGLHQHR